MTPDVLLIGCGNLGADVGTRLAARGHTVLALRRRADQVPPPLQGLSVDLTRDRPDLPPLDLAYLVVALSARTAHGGRLPCHLHRRHDARARRRGRRRPHAAACRAVSSTGVFGDLDPAVLADESTPPRPADGPARMLLQAEQAFSGRVPGSTDRPLGPLRSSQHATRRPGARRDGDRPEPVDQPHPPRRRRRCRGPSAHPGHTSGGSVCRDRRRAGAPWRCRCPPGCTARRAHPSCACRCSPRARQAVQQRSAARKRMGAGLPVVPRGLRVISQPWPRSCPRFSDGLMTSSSSRVRRQRTSCSCPLNAPTKQEALFARRGTPWSASDSPGSGCLRRRFEDQGIGGLLQRLKGLTRRELSHHESVRCHVQNGAVRDDPIDHTKAGQGQSASSRSWVSRLSPRGRSARRFAGCRPRGPSRRPCP